METWGFILWLVVLAGLLLVSVPGAALMVTFLRQAIKNKPPMEESRAGTNGGPDVS